MSKTSNGLFGFITGVVVGAALGILLAPDTGENTRKNIMDNTAKLKEKAEETLETLKKELDMLKNRIANGETVTEEEFEKVTDKIKQTETV